MPQNTQSIAPDVVGTDANGNPIVTRVITTTQVYQALEYFQLQANIQKQLAQTQQQITNSTAMLSAMQTATTQLSAILNPVAQPANPNPGSASIVPSQSASITP